MSETTPRKRRRVARYVSDVDRRLIEEGLPPSWEDRVRPEDTRPAPWPTPPTGATAPTTRGCSRMCRRTRRRGRRGSVGAGIRIGCAHPDRLCTSG